MKSSCFLKFSKSVILNLSLDITLMWVLQLLKIKVRISFPIQILQRHSNRILQFFFLIILIILNIITSLYILLQSFSLMFLNSMHIFQRIHSKLTHELISNFFLELLLLEISFINDWINKTLRMLEHSRRILPVISPEKIFVDLHCLRLFYLFLTFMGWNQVLVDACVTY